MVNNILQLKGTFEQRSKKSGFGKPKLPKNGEVSVSHIEKLLNDLKSLQQYWNSETLIKGALISVFYIDVIAKSRRISETFAGPGVFSNQSVVGAKFHSDSGLKHIITHYVSYTLLQDTISKYEKTIRIAKKLFTDRITDQDIEKLNSKKLEYNEKDLSQNAFAKIIIDSYFVEQFAIPVPDEEFKENSIITIYKTGVNTVDLMKKIGINILPNNIIDGTTMLLMPDALSLLYQKAPYLISMSVTDLNSLTKTDFEQLAPQRIDIPKPGNEPTIGVIDTLFNSNVYFSDWVDYTNMVDPNIEICDDDYFHGTAVTSIIVDGPSFNRKLDDGCGRFKVRHFGVATGGKFSSFSILKAINEIVTKNKDIKVWNLSLGSSLEISSNFISPEAAILDKIQYDNDVIFIIAGTNKPVEIKGKMKIGAPADSINSLVVNSVDFKNNPASYSREGPVLSFFIKPDISYYGGDKEKIRVCTPTGEAFVSGTSFAAPWIARKMSYLIDIMGFDRTTAKAILIDSATGWEKETVSRSLLGYGVVPIKIRDILETPSDEIKFVITGKSEKYDTYNYAIPVPRDGERYPFVSKVTMCYFPYCSRNQGVDYTNTELDISFGRIDKQGIKPINNNYQSAETGHFVYEKDARSTYRKWDNVKHIREVFTNRVQSKQVYGKNLWGISIKTKERLEDKYGENLMFGLVITLKEINGVNRIEDFIQGCILNNWFVNRVNIENKIDIYTTAEDVINFDEV